MRIGISTGGGDCPGLNAVIRAVTLSACNKYHFDVVGIEDGFEGLLDISKTRSLNVRDVEGIIGLGGTILGTTNRGNPFKYPVFDKDGKVTIENFSQRVVDNFKKLELDVLILVGGDGTLTIGNELRKMGLAVIGVPKTIDNDLLATDYTVGFNTAVTIATEAMDRLHTTAKSHHRAIVIELMGRYAGWITLEAGIAGAADVILIPEIPFEIDKVCNHVFYRAKEGKHYSLIVIAEGGIPLGRKVRLIEGAKDGTVERLGGIGYWVASEIQRISGIESRNVVLGHLQRGGPPTHFDRMLATRLGEFATELVSENQIGMMAAIQNGKIVAVPLEDAVEKLRLVDPNSEVIRVARSLGISFGN